jgi:hypothetical protein
VKRASAVLLAAVALAACAGEEEGASTQRTASSETTAAASEPETLPGQGETRALDAASRSTLQRVRAMKDSYAVVDERFGEGVRAVSGFDSKVHCWTPAGWHRLERIHGTAPDSLAGLADIFSLHIHLHPNICDELHALLAGERPQTGPDALALAGALVALTHEGMHLTSVGSNEAAAECKAIQNAHEVGVRLGVEEEYGHRLALIYWEELYRADDPVYGSPQCQDGGSLDVNPDSSVWP